MNSDLNLKLIKKTISNKTKIIFKINIKKVDI